MRNPQPTVAIVIEDVDLDAHRNEEIIQALANRDYHIPGNNWCQDWWAWIGNNHPLFAMCCRHRLHPLKSNEIFVHYMSSVLFGLALTSVVFLYFKHNDLKMDNVIVTVPSVTVNATNPLQNDINFADALKDTSLRQYEYDITNGDLILWTIGGVLHGIFDLSIWHLSACSLCLPGGMCKSLRCCRALGEHCVLVIAFVITAFTMFVVLERAAVEGDGTGKASFKFIKVYLIQVFLAQFCYFPFLFTIEFSGVLGCGCLPILGGRPREIQLETRRQMKRSTTQITETSSSE